MLHFTLETAGYLSINFLPNAVYKPELCIRATLAAAEQYSFPPDRLLFEVTESERVEDVGHLKSIINDYKSRGKVCTTHAETRVDARLFTS